MTDMNTVAGNMGDAIKAFRSAAVTAENKATPMARSILAALMTGAVSPDKVVMIVIDSFGNPKSPKTGKPIEKLSGLRDFVGGDATRKTVESILKVHDNVKGDAALTKLATSFILEATGAPKSLRALEVAVKDAMRAEVAKGRGTENESAETNTGTIEAPVAAETLADRLNKMALEIAGIADEDMGAVDAALTALRNAIGERYNAYAVAQLKLAA